jgi:hypothetical protein
LGAVFQKRATASAAFVTAPLPPPKVKRLLLVNTGGTDMLWTQLSIVKNQPNLVSNSLQFWQGAATGLGGWVDPGGRVLTGDFLPGGQQRIVFFNTDPLGGIFSIRSLTGAGSNGAMTVDLLLDWNDTLRTKLSGWIDTDDKILGGNFLSLGQSQFLFFNKSQSPAAFQIAAINATNNDLQIRATIPWTAGLTSSLSGWIDSGDKLVSGDFLGTGLSQLMFINTVGGVVGAASIRQYDTTTNSFQTLNTVPWNKIVGNSQLWTEQTVKTVTGDFLGMGRDQLLLVNPSGTGIALSFWNFDSATNSFVEIHKMNWSPSEVPNLNGFLDAYDWQLSY